jgi:hypothetical protein
LASYSGRFLLATSFIPSDVAVNASSSGTATEAILNPDSVIPVADSKTPVVKFSRSAPGFPVD